MDEQTRMAFALGGSIDLDTVPDNTQGIDPVSGNEVPIGSTAEEVRDDIPAQLSEGEYVVPADVVRYYGVRFFEELRAKAKFGFQDMAENGRIGGEPTDEPDMEMMFDVSELEVEDDGKPMEMDEGGYALSPGDEGYDEMGALGLGSTGITAGYESTGTAPTVEVRTYVNEAGHSIYITFINGKPQTSIPPGYTLQAEVVEEAPASAAQPEPEPLRRSTNDDGKFRTDNSSTATPPVNYKELTTKEIAGMLEDQNSKKSTAIAFAAGAINPLLGVFVKGAMMHSARSLEKEIERRITSPEYTKDKGVLEDLLKASQDGKPGLISKIYGAMKEAFVPENKLEAEALEKAIAMEAGAVYDFEGNIIEDAISSGDPAITGMDLEKTVSPVEVVENTLAPTTGRVSTYIDPMTRKETQFESYGQVTRNGVYSGDGFEWYNVEDSNGNPMLDNNGDPVLGRRYTKEGEDNGLGTGTIAATEIGYGTETDRATFVKIADLSMKEGSEFASTQGSANDGDWAEFIRSGFKSFGASDSYAAMKAKETGDKNDYSPTLTYGDILEQVRNPEVKIEEPEVKIEEPRVEDQDAEAQEILDMLENSKTPVIENPAGEVFTKENKELLPYSTQSNYNPNEITTKRLDMGVNDTITPEESKRRRDIRKAKEAEAQTLANLKAQKDAGNFATEEQIRRARDRGENVYGERLSKTQDQKTRAEKMADRDRSRSTIEERTRSGQFDSRGRARGGRAKGGLMKKAKKK